MHDRNDSESPRAQLRRVGLFVLLLIILGGGGIIWAVKSIDTDAPSFSAAAEASDAAKTVLLKPSSQTLAAKDGAAADPKASTPPAAPKGMPASGPQVCKSSKDGGRCFNYQLKSGTCSWSGAKYPKNVKLGWRINQAPGGFGAKYWNSWCKLGMAESGWKHTSQGSYVKTLAEDGKPRGRACGIMQALPCRKVHGGIKLSPEGQITWMRNYIRRTYGNPDAAWQHEIRYQWY